MITDLIILTFLLPFFMAGVKKPELAYSGLLIVEIIRPQTMSYGIVGSLPMSAIAYAALMISFLINVKKLKTPKPITPVILIFLFMAWITYTTNHAFFPEQAKFLWDSAFKNMLIFLFFPFILYKRQHFELILIVILFCISYFISMAGVKTVMGGGGYKAHLISAIGGGGSQPLAESSTLAMACVFSIPLMTYAIKHNGIFSTKKIIRLSLITNITLAIPAVVGTAARTGILCLVAFLSLKFISTNKKLLYMVVIFASIALLIGLAPPEWIERMSTLSEGSNASSGRVAVWKWTLSFVQENPNGGGFYAYIANRHELQNFLSPGQQLFDMENGKAFHNTFFQTLGEHGYIGFSLYFSMTILTYVYTIKIKKKELRNSLFIAYTIFNVGSMFIGIAYLIWQYLFLNLCWLAFSYEKRESICNT